MYFCPQGRVKNGVGQWFGFVAVGARCCPWWVAWCPLVVVPLGEVWVSCAGWRWERLVGWDTLRCDGPFVLPRLLCYVFGLFPLVFVIRFWFGCIGCAAGRFVKQLCFDVVPFLSRTIRDVDAICIRSVDPCVTVITEDNACIT